MDIVCFFEDCFGADLVGVVCVGDSIAVNDRSKFETLCNYLKKNEIDYDYDEDNYSEIYLVVLR